MIDFVKVDSVILYNSRMHLFPRKLRSRWSCPFKIIEVLANREVEVESHKERFKANEQRLNKYYGKPPDV